MAADGNTRELRELGPSQLEIVHLGTTAGSRYRHKQLKLETTLTFVCFIDVISSGAGPRDLRRTNRTYYVSL